MRGCTEDLCNTPNEEKAALSYIRQFRRPVSAKVFYDIKVVCYENLSTEGGHSAWRRFWPLMMVTHKCTVSGIYINGIRTIGDTEPTSNHTAEGH